MVGIGRGRGARAGVGVVRKREDEESSEVGGTLKRPRSIGHGSPLEDPAGAYPPSEYNVRSGHHENSPYSTQGYHDNRIDPRLQIQTAVEPRHERESAQSINTDVTLLQTPVYNSHEALLTLIEAAGKDTPMSTGVKSNSGDSDSEGEGDDTIFSKGPGEDRHHQSNGDYHHNRNSPVTRGIGAGVRFSEMASPSEAAGSSFTSSHVRRRAASTSTVSPGLRSHARSLSISAIQDPKEREGMEKSIRAWNKFRFVKGGWFTAREAIGYVEYFYHHLHPLSPTLTSPNLQHITHPIHHPMLLKHEPFLTTIILLITSRYLVLSGPGGVSRSYAIHDMLWREVRGGCEGLMWGGGWGGLGTPHAGSSMGGFGAMGPGGPASKSAAKGLRTLGTVEGLLILTEWHVRGLHFPMDVEEGYWMVDVSDDEDDYVQPGRAKRARPKGGVVEGLGDRIENILEPAYRSDRMSWMLLGNALALAYELGVFDEIDEPAPQAPLHADLDASRLRFQRIQKLLLVYVLQLASRLGWTSMIPRHITHAVRHKLNSQAPSPASISVNSAPSSSWDLRGSRTRWENEDELQDVVFHTWVDLTMLMKSSGEKLFPSRSVTKSIMRTGKYVALLEHFQPLLKDWKRDFEALGLPEPIQHILTMEYEHVRFYINSLALQAVVDRCTYFNNTKASNRPTSANGAVNGNGNGTNNHALLMQMSPKDLGFINEVVDASRALLRCVVEKMLPGGHLKHAPVRIYLRILSASMFLLKTFALGAPEEEVMVSITLIDQTVEALRSASVDDVHLGLRFADLLETLTKRIRSRFVRMSRSRPSTPVPPSTTPSKVNIDMTNPRTHDADPSMEMPPPPTPTEMGYEPGVNYTHEGFTGGEVQDDPNFFIGYEDWLALPIDPIVGGGFNGVTQSQMGPDVGGVDLLELLLSGGGSTT